MRKRNGVILVVIGYIVFSFCMEVWGVDWKYIGKDVQSAILEIDLASISRQPNNIVRVWFKFTHSKESRNALVKKWGS